MIINKIISHEWILPQLQVENWRDAITVLGELLAKHGLVKGTYVPAVLAREEKYPTGVPLGAINVAIPHTDIVHVHQPAIAVATLDRPVRFGNMGEPGSDIDVHIVFLLAMKDPEAQVDLLQNLVTTFQDGEVLKTLADIRQADEIEAILTKHLCSKE